MSELLVCKLHPSIKRVWDERIVGLYVASKHKKGRGCDGLVIGEERILRH